MEKQSPILLSFSLLVSLSVMASGALAAELNYYGIETDIEMNLVATISVTMIVDSPINQLDYELDYNVMEMSVNTSSGTKRCSLENTDDKSVISCDFYGMSMGENTITLSFSTRDGVKRLDDKYEFKTDFPVPMKADRVYSIIKLPPKAILSEEVVNQSYFPPDGNVLTDGKRFIVSWQNTGIEEGKTINLSVLFQVIGSGDTMWDMSVILMTAAVVIVMIVVAIYLRRSSPTTKETEVKVLPLLNKDEKKVVDIIARSDDQSVRQSAIVKESDYSKAKVSRLVKNLKERGVVDTEPISGRENKVILKIKGVE